MPHFSLVDAEAEMDGGLPLDCLVSFAENVLAILVDVG